MSLDVTLTENRPVAVFKYNITHNLTKMADAVGLYEYLWRPEEVRVTTASQLIEPLKRGLEKLEDEPERYNRFNPDNGWGDYTGLVRFVRAYLKACEENPNAAVGVDR